MEGMTKNTPFAVMTAAVMSSPRGTPIYREIAYSRHPYSKIKEKRVRVWRINTPHSFLELSNDDRDKEQDARRTVHGLKYLPNISEKRKNIEQYETYSVVKEAWKEHCQKTGKRVTVFHVQEELRELLKLLEIPSIPIKTAFKGKDFDPYGKHLTEIAPEFTCQLPHDYDRPCQATLAMRWALFVHDALKEVPQKPKTGSWADRVEEDEKKEANLKEGDKPAKKCNGVSKANSKKETK